MTKRVALLIALATICSMGAEFRTPNFTVISANQQVCELVGKWAEHYRKEKAIQWLGREMPQWPDPCPLRVNVSMEGPSGETEFTFGPGRVNSQRMTIRGPLDRLIHSVLPHEITHTVFAHHFKTPVPRWADEGGSVLSEDDVERDRHDKVVRSILNKGQQIPTRTLLGLKEYPPQVMCLYAQGFSMCDYLVKRSNKQHFLNFVGHGMQYGWDHACKSYYSHNSVEELEQAWLTNLRESKKQPAEQMLAANPNPNTNAGAVANSNFVGNSSAKTVRMTVPPAQPLDPQGIARGAMPSQERNSGSTQWQPSVRLEAPVPIHTPIPRAVQPASSPQVQLGTPVDLPRTVAPVAYPR
jgi:hypothetical protein